MWPIKYNSSLMKVNKSKKLRLNSLLLPWNWFMQNDLLISKIAWPHPKGSKLFQVSEPSIEQDDSDIFQIDKGLIQHLSSEDEKDSYNSEWEFEDGNIFGVIAQELWFVIFIDFLQSYFQNTLHLNFIFILSIFSFSLYEIVLD